MNTGRGPRHAADPAISYEALGVADYRMYAGAREFNRGIRRGRTILVAGDRARFALMATLPEERSDPDLITLGDGRVRIREGDNETWLDLLDGTTTVFRPNGTLYARTLDAGVSFRYHVYQAQDWGVVAEISLANGRDDTATLDGNEAAFSAPAIPLRVAASANADATTLQDHRAAWPHRVVLAEQGTATIRLVVALGDDEDAARAGLRRAAAGEWSRAARRGQRQPASRPPHATPA